MAITIISQVPLSVQSPVSSRGALLSSNSETTASSQAFQKGDLESTSTLINTNQLTASGSSSLFQSGDLSSTGYLSLLEFFTNFAGNAIQISPDLDKQAFLNLVTGDVPAHLSDLVVFVNLQTIDTFDYIKSKGNLKLDEKTLEFNGNLILTGSGGPTSSGNLNLIDAIGPIIENEVPQSGSVFNDPNTDITFDLIDEAAGIEDNSISFYINGTQVVQNGIALTVPSFGQTFLNKISDNLFEFTFIKDTPFSFSEVVEVSGIALDSSTASNSGIFLYEFAIWQESDLTTDITGLPDTQAPFLTNLLPVSGQIQVDLNSNITLDIADLHTGVDEDSVDIYVEGNQVVSGGQVTGEYALVTIISVPSINGFRYIIDPFDSLPIFSNIEVEVKASDLFTISGSPNVLDTSYFFQTLSNADIVISGFKVFINGSGYVDFDVEDTVPTEDPTNFRITYSDLSGSGIDINNSSVSIDGVTLTGVSFTEVISGSNDSYFVDFSVFPDYEGESSVLFRAEQTFSGSLSGTVAPFRETLSTLQWGYKICHNPSLDNEESYQYCVKVCDSGNKPSLGNFCSQFTVEPPEVEGITASIVGIQPPNQINFNAGLNSINTFFEYNKDMEIEIEAKDFNGNTLYFIWNFKIEEAS